MMHIGMKTLFQNYALLLVPFCLATLFTGCTKVAIERNIAFNQSLEDYEDTWLVPKKLEHKVVSKWRVWAYGKDKVDALLKDYEQELAGKKAKRIYKFSKNELLVKTFAKGKNKRTEVCTFKYTPKRKTFFKKDLKAHAFKYTGVKKKDLIAKKQGNCSYAESITFPIAMIRNMQMTPSGPFQAEISGTVQRAVSVHWALQRIDDPSQVRLGANNTLRISPRGIATSKKRR